MNERAHWVTWLRYGAALLGAVVLWIQVSISDIGNGFLICMGAVCAFFSMTNRLTSLDDTGSRKIPVLLALFGFAFSLLFVNEIQPYMRPGLLRSGLIVLALVSGIWGTILSQRRPANIRGG